MKKINVKNLAVVSVGGLARTTVLLPNKILGLIVKGGYNSLFKNKSIMKSLAKGFTEGLFNVQGAKRSGSNVTTSLMKSAVTIPMIIPASLSKELTQVLAQVQQSRIVENVSVFFASAEFRSNEDLNASNVERIAASFFKENVEVLAKNNTSELLLENFEESYLLEAEDPIKKAKFRSREHIRKLELQQKEAENRREEARKKREADKEKWQAEAEAKRQEAKDKQSTRDQEELNKKLEKEQDKKDAEDTKAKDKEEREAEDIKKRLESEKTNLEKIVADEIKQRSNAKFSDISRKVFQTPYSYASIVFKGADANGTERHLIYNLPIRVVGARISDDEIVETLYKFTEANSNTLTRLGKFVKKDLTFTQMVFNTEFQSFFSKLAKVMGRNWLELVRKTKYGATIVITSHMEEQLKEEFEINVRDRKTLKNMIQFLGILDFFIIDMDAKTIDIADSTTLEFVTYPLAQVYKDASDIMGNSVVMIQTGEGN